MTPELPRRSASAPGVEDAELLTPAEVKFAVVEASGKMSFLKK